MVINPHAIFLCVVYETRSISMFRNDQNIESWFLFVYKSWFDPRQGQGQKMNSQSPLLLYNLISPFVYDIVIFFFSVSCMTILELSSLKECMRVGSMKNLRPARQEICFHKTSTAARPTDDHAGHPGRKPRKPRRRWQFHNQPKPNNSKARNQTSIFLQSSSQSPSLDRSLIAIIRGVFESSVHTSTT